MTREELTARVQELAMHEGLLNLNCDAVCSDLEIGTAQFRQIARCTFTELIDELYPMMGDQSHIPITARAILPKYRRASILSIFMQMAKQECYATINVSALAESAHVSSQTIYQYFPNTALLQHALMLSAVKHEVLRPLGAGIALQHPIATAVPAALQKKALLSLMS